MCVCARICTCDVCRWWRNSSIVVLEMLMSLNMPSSLEVNWHPHSVWERKHEYHISNRGIQWKTVKKRIWRAPLVWRSYFSRSHLKRSYWLRVFWPGAVCSNAQTRPSPAWTWTTPWLYPGWTPLPVPSAEHKHKHNYKISNNFASVLFLNYLYAIIIFIY